MADIEELVSNQLYYTKCDTNHRNRFIYYNMICSHKRGTLFTKNITICCFNSRNIVQKY